MMMRFIDFEKGATFESLKVSYTLIPSILENEVLVKVHSFGVNRADILQRLGKYPLAANANPILGLEVSGVVEAIGKNVQSIKIGDRVCGLVNGGGYAEYVSIHKSCVLHIDNIDFEIAAVIPEAYMVGMYAFSMLSNVDRHSKVLIHAGASGIGLAAIQIAKLLGATVAVTCSAKKKTHCFSVGADIVIDYDSDDFEITLFKSEFRPTVILDMIGVPYLQKNIKIAADNATLIIVGLLGGAKGSEINLSLILTKQLNIKGMMLRNLDINSKASLVTMIQKKMIPLIKEGSLQPLIYKKMRASDIAIAHQLIESNATFGKLVISWT